MNTVIDYSDYKFRCSQLGKLMVGVSVGLTERQEETFSAYDSRYKGNGKPLTEIQLKDYFDLGSKKFGKKVGLSTTTINYLKEIHRERVFGRTKEIRSKYLEKGIQVEELSLSLYTEVKNTLVIKNKERLSNGFITGEPDSRDRVKSLVRDFKSSWDFSTFPFFEIEIPNSDYEWQLDGYMELTALDNSELIYSLVDTPFKQIDDELRRLDWNHNIYTLDGDVREECIDFVVETVSNLIYSKKGLQAYCHQSSSVNIEWFKDFKEIPEEMRIKVFHRIKDPNRITALYNQIKLCREYLNQLSGFKTMAEAV